MILHAAELWVALAVCFVVGCLTGSLLHRAIGLTGAGRLQARMVHGIDRAIRIVEWRLFPSRARGPVPLPRVVPVTAPDYALAEPVRLPAAVEWGDEHAAELDAPPPSLESGGARSVFEAEHLTDAVERADALGTRPVVLSGPRFGRPDEIALIRGLGKRHAARLAAIGVYHFSQIAAWTPQETAWIGAYLGIGDTVREKDWVGQATRAAGADDPEAALRPPPKKKPAGKPRSRRGKTKRTRPSEPESATVGEGAPADEPAQGSSGRGVDPVEEVGDP